MMMNNVVKLINFTRLLDDFVHLIKSDTTKFNARNSPSDFSRNRIMTFDYLILYLIFRNRKNTDAELIKFFSSFDQLDKKISKQALHKNLEKLNPYVFLYLFKEFASLYYHSNLSLTYKGYTLLAEDGTFLEIPYDIMNIFQFDFLPNQHIHDMFDVKKIISKSAGLYDITNGFFVDFTMKDVNCSELPLAFRHLYRTSHLYKDKKVIYLADRYYGSAELLSFLDLLGYKYCIRAKSNFYKKQVQNMSSNDEWINVEITKSWLKRFNNSPETKNYIEKHPILKIRVVKRPYIYYDKYGCLHMQQMTYFTNLNSDEFSDLDIQELYAMRWDIETAYKILKTNLEIERHISRNPNIALCCEYAKIIFFNIMGIHRKAINHQLSKNPYIKYKVVNKKAVEDFRYDAVNISQLINCIYENNYLGAFIFGDKRIILKKLFQIFKVCEKLKVPIRNDRHNDRWGRVVPSGFPYRFSLDGRNFPKLKTIKGIMRTTNP